MSMKRIFDIGSSTYFVYANACGVMMHIYESGNNPAKIGIYILSPRKTAITPYSNFYSYISKKRHNDLYYGGVNNPEGLHNLIFQGPECVLDYLEKVQKHYEAIILNESKGSGHKTS